MVAVVPEVVTVGFMKNTGVPLALFTQESYAVGAEVLYLIVLLPFVIALAVMSDNELLTLASNLYVQMASLELLYKV